MLHIAPSWSAGASLLEAIRRVRSRDEVLAWRDDLSCGPIDTDELPPRAAFWGDYDENFAEEISIFWEKLRKNNENIVIWFTRHSSAELAFFLNLADRLKDRPYLINDPTSQRVTFVDRDRSIMTTEPTKAISLLPSGALAKLLGMEKQLPKTDREAAQIHWRKLKKENAPFRIVTAGGLISAPSETFDNLILKEAALEWQRLARLIGFTMGNNSDPYIQVGDCMLHRRAVALIEQGSLLAEGDPWDLRKCRVRLPSGHEI